MTNFHHEHGEPAYTVVVYINKDMHTIRAKTINGVIVESNEASLVGKKIEPLRGYVMHLIN